MCIIYRKILRLLAVALISIQFSPATAEIINFDEYGLAAGNSMTFAVGTVTKGYSFEPGDWYCDTGCSFATFSDTLTVLNPNGSGSLPASSTAVSAYDDIWMSNGGAAFSLSQIDFSGAGELWITGYTDAALTTFAQTIFSQDSSYAFSTYALAYTNVYGVMFEHINGPIGAASNLFALDNLHVGVAVVPLPPALFMFIPGLLGLGFMARRNRKQV